MFEEAKIDGAVNEEKQKQVVNDVKPVFPDMIPSVLTMDDFVYEIGKINVQKANIERVVDKVAKQLEQEKQKNNQLVIKLQRTAGLEKSNQQYQENNRMLDKALVEERSKVDQLTKKITELEINKQTLESEIKNQGKIIDEYKQKNKNQKKTTGTKKK